MEGEELEKEVTEDLLMEFCHHKEQSNGVEAGGESGGSRKDLGNVHCAQHQVLHSLLYNLNGLAFAFIPVLGRFSIICRFEKEYSFFYIYF